MSKMKGMPLIHKSRVRNLNPEKRMQDEISREFEKLKDNFSRIASPDRVKLIENEKEMLRAFLYGTPTPGEINRSRKHFVFNHVAEYILKGKKRVFQKSDVGGYFAYNYRPWTIEAEAKYKFLKWLEASSDDQVKNDKVFSYTAYAYALSLKNITIDKKGIGVIDEIDYVQKFGLASRKTFYNKWNSLDTIADLSKFADKAQQIIKKHNL